MAFIQYYETDEQEQRRLALSPEGSRNHFWSTLPVTIDHPDEGIIVRVPMGPQHIASDGEPMLVVTLVEYRAAVHCANAVPSLPRRYDGSWRCIVVASNIPSCPVGGNHLDIPVSQLRRGALLTPEQILGAFVTTQPQAA